jgi:Family of unknown function (DUF6502)
MNKKGKSLGSSDPLRDATLRALSQLIDPILTLMFDSRVTVRELTQLLRGLAVTKAASRIANEAGHGTKSRISILTGLPRSEVTRLLKRQSSFVYSDIVQHPTRKVMSAWFDDSAFLTKEGDPEILPAFGKRKSFERLVDKHGGGVPVRAMLDELTRIDAIEWLSGQRIRPRNRIPMMTGLTPASILMMGQRGRNLLDTLIANARSKINPLFEATSAMDNVDSSRISIGRREVFQQGTNFISGIDGLFNQLQQTPGRKANKPKVPGKRVGVTVFYFEDASAGAHQLGAPPIVARKNLRRTQA